MHAAHAEAHAHARTLGEAVAKAVHYAVHEPHQRIIVILKGISIDKDGSVSVDTEVILEDEDLETPLPELLRKRAEHAMEEFHLAQERAIRKHAEELFEWEERLRMETYNILMDLSDVLRQARPHFELDLTPPAQEIAGAYYAQLQNDYPAPEPDEPSDDMAA